MAKKKTDKKKLDLWKERLSKNEAAYNAELVKMDHREDLYLGTHKLRQMVEKDEKTETPHVRNLISEIIEAEVDSNLPAPKVTARRKEDEGKAKIIEDMLRNEMDRLPFEQLNDMMERTVPIQGGAAFLVEWDNSKRTHYTVGELDVKTLHPKQIIPQDGVTSCIEDMDYIILKLPVTREMIKARYGIEVDETEAEPDVRGSQGAANAEDMLTEYVAYYRNSKGGIGKYAWVSDTQIEDLEDYQARRLRRCKQCGAPEPPAGIEPMPQLDVFAGLPEMPMGDMMESPLDTEVRAKVPSAEDRKVCPYCGGEKWEEVTEDYQEIIDPIARTDGSIIPGLHPVEHISEYTVDASGLPVVEITMEPTKIPIYKPDIYPIILQKTVSVYGRFLGDSDTEKIEDQQNTVNRLEAKIIDKIIGSGSYITLPDDDTHIAVDPKIGTVIYPASAASMSMISHIDMEAAISQDMAYMEQCYQEARQIIGITDSFQGRKDATATSGKAKEFAAAQSAGRLESKRIQKNAAYAALFEAMFKFKLSCADEPRPVVSEDFRGDRVYEDFNRYDFLEQDAAGEWCWNDQFLFSVDTAAPLASNREAMWQETRLNLQTGAFGDPASDETLLLFWQKMEQLHYPGAGETKQFIEDRIERNTMAQQMQMAQQYAIPQAPMPVQNESVMIQPNTAAVI